MGVPGDRGPELAHLIENVDDRLISNVRPFLERPGRSDKNRQRIDPCAQ
jgi:hypothetical protein